MGTTVANFALGFVLFALSPLRNEFLKYPALYRSEEGIKSAMPIGMAAMFIAMLSLVRIQTTISARVLSTIAFNSSCSLCGTPNLSIVC